VLTVAQLTETLRQMPPDATIEVWSLAGTHGSYDVDVDVKVQPIHDHDQAPVALAIIAARPDCSHTAEDPGADNECWRRADIELTDRTGHRHPLCSAHAEPAWDGELNGAPGVGTGVVGRVPTSDASESRLSSQPG